MCAPNGSGFSLSSTHILGCSYLAAGGNYPNNEKQHCHIRAAFPEGGRRPRPTALGAHAEAQHSVRIAGAGVQHGGLWGQVMVRKHRGGRASFLSPVVSPGAGQA